MGLKTNLALGPIGGEAWRLVDEYEMITGKHWRGVKILAYFVKINLGADEGKAHDRRTHI